MIMQLKERYRLLKVIGCGSEGKVYLAIQNSTQRFLAVKEITKSGPCYSQEGIAVWKRLHHAHLPEIIDLIEEEDRVYVVMEYVEGTTLSKWVHAHGCPHGFLLLQWLLAICDTLEYLHGQEPPVIFGDLKPENIMIQKERPILVDLGSAYVKGSKGKRTGTYRLVEKSGRENSDVSTDIFCLGKTLECILTGNEQRYRRFAGRAMGLKKKKFTSITQCKRYLHMQILIFVVTLLLLITGIAFLAMAKEKIQKERELQTAKEEIHGMQQLLDELLEDLVLDENEYITFWDAWEKVEKNGRKQKEICRDNLTEYAQLCYRMGTSCWYLASEWNGRRFASGWFDQAEQIPGKWQKNSESYRRIGELSKEIRLLAATGETDRRFLTCYREMKELSQQEDGVFLLWVYQEMELFLIHYLPYLKQSGLQESEVMKLEEEIESAVHKEEDQREIAAELRENTAKLLKEEQELRKRLYKEKESDEGKKK